MKWLKRLVLASHRQLDERCMDALLDRGVSEEQAYQFEIGYLNGKIPVGAPQDFKQWAHQKGRIQDVFVFPLTNVVGEVLGVQFRKVDREAKGYTEYHVHRGEAHLFGLGQAASYLWSYEQVVLVEGVFDLLPLQRILPQVVSTLTARVPNNLVATLDRLLDDVWVCYDADDAGRRGTQLFKKYHGKRFHIQDLSFNGVRQADGTIAKDPGDVWSAWGDDRLYDYLSRVDGLKVKEP